MSFGFSPSDIVALVNIVAQTYRGWKTACGHYADITGALDGLLILLERIEDESEQPRTALVRSRKDRKDLDDMISACHNTIDELSSIITEYRSLGLGKSREKNWDRIRFGNKNLDSLKAKLLQHHSALSAHLNAVGLSSLTRIERDLHALPDKIQRTVDGLAAEIRAGRREGSIMTTYDDDEKEVWKQFRRELIGDGMRSSVVHKYKPKIRQYLRALADDGMLEEEKSPSDDEAVLPDHGELPSEHEELPDTIQQIVDGLAAEIRAGRGEGSIMTTHEDGMKSSFVHKDKPQIRRYLEALAEDGMLEEAELSESDQAPEPSHFGKYDIGAIKPNLPCPESRQQETTSTMPDSESNFNTSKTLEEPDPPRNVGSTSASMENEGKRVDEDDQISKQALSRPSRLFQTTCETDDSSEESEQDACADDVRITECDDSVEKGTPDLENAVTPRLNREATTMPTGELFTEGQFRAHVIQGQFTSRMRQSQAAPVAESRAEIPDAERQSPWQAFQLANAGEKRPGSSTPKRSGGIHPNAPGSTRGLHLRPLAIIILDTSQKTRCEWVTRRIYEVKVTLRSRTQKPNQLSHCRKLDIKEIDPLSLLNNIARLGTIFVAAVGSQSQSLALQWLAGVLRKTSPTMSNSETDVDIQLSGVPGKISGPAVKILTLKTSIAAHSHQHAGIVG